MKTQFEEYLENIQFFADEEALKKKAGKKKTVLDLSKSQSCIVSANDGPIDMISRVFNEYPLIYSAKAKNGAPCPDRRIYCVANEKTILQWRENYAKIIRSRTFKLTTIGNSAAVLTTVETEQAAKEFAASVISGACLDLLDPQGKLKPSIIKALFLDGLLSKYQNNPAKLAEITHHLLFAYCTHLVCTSLYDITCSRTPVNQEDYQCYGAEVRHGNYFNRFFRELLITSDAGLNLKFTPFFKNKIQDCLALQAIQNNQYDKLVSALLKRSDTDDIAAELKEFSSSKENRITLVEHIKGVLQQYDTATQIEMLDAILANSTLGILLRDPRHPYYDNVTTMPYQLLAWLTSTPIEPTFTNSIHALRTHRDRLATQVENTNPAPALKIL
jgi:hypothetical protein